MPAHAGPFATSEYKAMNQKSSKEAHKEKDKGNVGRMLQYMHNRIPVGSSLKPRSSNLFRRNADSSRRFYVKPASRDIPRVAGSMLSTTTRTCARPSVLYKDRGVIVLNKPPGLVSQGTSSTTAGPKNIPLTAPPRRAAFNDVLDGTVQRFVTSFV